MFLLGFSKKYVHHPLIGAYMKSTYVYPSLYCIYVFQYHSTLFVFNLKELYLWDNLGNLVFYKSNYYSGRCLWSIRSVIFTFVLINKLI